MPLYAEGILWYLLLIDCLIYNVLAWKRKQTHWASDHVPVTRLLGLFYLIATLWLGFALLRLQIILFR